MVRLRSSQEATEAVTEDVSDRVARRDIWRGDWIESCPDLSSESFKEILIGG